MNTRPRGPGWATEVRNLCKASRRYQWYANRRAPLTSESRRGKWLYNRSHRMLNRFLRRWQAFVRSESGRTR